MAWKEEGQGRAPTTFEIYINRLKEAKDHLIAEALELRNLKESIGQVNQSQSRKAMELRLKKELENAPTEALPSYIVESVEKLDRVLEKSSNLKGEHQGALKNAAATISAALTHLIARRDGHEDVHEREAEIERLRQRSAELEKTVKTVTEENDSMRKELSAQQQTMTEMKSQLDWLKEELQKGERGKVQQDRRRSREMVTRKRRRTMLSTSPSSTSPLPSEEEDEGEEAPTPTVLGAECPNISMAWKEEGQGRAPTTFEIYINRLKEAKDHLIAEALELRNLKESIGQVNQSQSRKAMELRLKKELENAPTEALPSYIVESVEKLDRVLEKSSNLKGEHQGALKNAAATISAALTHLIARRDGHEDVHEREAEIERLRQRSAELEKTVKTVTEENDSMRKELSAQQQTMTEMKSQLDWLKEELQKGERGKVQQDRRRSREMVTRKRRRTMLSTSPSSTSPLPSEEEDEGEEAPTPT
ncbi:protein CROWDED NUCLEI 2-like, partial [Temnothorax curvispinosus]|uniref:Protein CROWDED NUCLEI 2-like n=1 Tax=Temnothorax curvispinosus TaxID=300111 RepID=A0A6J1Q869_9HYME